MNNKSYQKLLQNFKTIHAVFPDKSLTEKFIGEKELKRTIKGTNKYKVADSLLQKYNMSHSMFVPDLKFLDAAVSE